MIMNEMMPAASHVYRLAHDQRNIRPGFEDNKATEILQDLLKGGIKERKRPSFRMDSIPQKGWNPFRSSK